MRITPLITAVSVAITAAGLIVACSKGSDGPTSPFAPPVPPGESTALGLEIVGPDSVAPGETRQFTSMLRLRDGSSRDVTNQSTWQNRAGDILSIPSPGQVTGIRSGEGPIAALYRGTTDFTATRDIIVLPTGTFRLAGIVTEAELPTLPVVGARLDVLEGAGAGLSTMTAGDGRYRLYGVATGSQIRVSHDGYEPVIHNVDISAHAIQTFALKLSRPRMDVSGRYALTIEAAEACRAKLPEEAWRRVYSVAVAQQGPQLEASLSGATFATNRLGSGSKFRGGVELEQVKFTLNLAPYYNYYPYSSYYPDVVEQLSAGFLIMSGSVVLTASRGGFSGTMNGLVAVWPSDPRQVSRQSPIGTCQSPVHQFVLTR